VEAVFDQMKTHLQQRRRVLRSKAPAGVRQEFYGWVLAHYAACWLMHEAAIAQRIEQRRLSDRELALAAPRPTPKRGLTPQSDRGCDAAGSLNSCARPPACVM
jgi:hypothetical protein